MNLKVEWNKIVTNAISTLVVAVFVGAMAIVWNSAMTVDTKVQSTREDMTHLIDTLSDKLAAYEVQLTFFSNQLTAVIQNQTNLITATLNNQTRTAESLPNTTFSPLGGLLGNSPRVTPPLKLETEITKDSFAPPPKPESDVNKDNQQRVISMDIKQQFKR